MKTGPVSFLIQYLSARPELIAAAMIIIGTVTLIIIAWTK